MTMRQLFAVVVLLLLVARSASAVSFPDRPPAGRWVVDSAGIIEPPVVSDIVALADVLMTDKRVPIYVVTVPSLASQGATPPIEPYAMALFNHWGIGTQERNLGVLLLVSVADRKARIELGADWQRAYDGPSATVMSELIIPAFKRGNYSTGILDGVRGLDAMVRGALIPSPTRPWWWWPAIVIGALSLAFLIHSLVTTGKAGWGWLVVLGVGMFLLGVLKVLNTLSSHSTRGGYGGGYSGGGGGGSSGGGGATGSW